MRRLLVAVSIIAVAGAAGALSVRAVDQMKTVESFVGDSDAAISGAVSKTFAVYIGDDLTGVTNPVKSVFVVISGVYTSGGTLTVNLGGATSTEKVYTMTNVGAAVPFEIFYKDPSGSINPQTPGSYTYTLNLTPAGGLSISHLGVNAVTTYRYKPPACPDGQPTAEKIKTNEYFVGDSILAFSTPIDRTFSIYIGDNISGVASAIKSSPIIVSGVYTGDGTLKLRFNSDEATAQTFTLPNVGATPKPFEIHYQNTAAVTPSPVTAGTYTYTLNVIPSGVTISSFGAKVQLTYRYKPPSCGGTLPVTGDLTSVVFDTGVTGGATYNSMMWKGTAGTGKVRFQIATSNSDAGPWTYIGGSTCGVGDWYSTTGSNAPAEITCAPQNHDNHRYFKYKVQLCSNTDCSTVGATSPTVEDVVISWSP